MRIRKLISSVVILIILVGCSTSSNTARSRWWQSFNARYNTYFNGSQAFIDGAQEKENGNKDNFTETIPLYTVSNKASKTLGGGNFDRAIEKMEKAIKQHSIKRRPEWTKNRRKTTKDIEWLNRREYNPFLWRAWLLMGKAQFQKGQFEEAAATFSYMSRLYSTQPAINGIARAWLAKSYTELDWLYDAEDVINKMKRDTMDYRAVADWDYTYADYYIHNKQYSEAVKYLRKVIKHEHRKKQKAREWYLLGQLQSHLGNREDAYKSFKHVVRLNPPYELEFNAHIAQTEVMAKGHAKQMVSKLRRMARSDNNKDYLDQVYYAIGNIYLADRDTLHAIAAYEEGNKKATRSGIEKGVLLLNLGNLYWAKEKYSDAKRCYGEAIGLLDKERDDYEQLSQRSKVLDELVPYTDAVQLQDSLQVLAKMNEADRNKAIDRVIDALKKKEKEEKRAAQEANAEKTLQQQGAIGNRMNNQRKTTTTTTQTNGAWYFYNPTAVSQGKAAFQRQWGKRENVDNWQRVNKTVVSLQGQSADQQTDSTAQTGADEQKDKVKKDSAAADTSALDPHKREYYMAQIPFTDEQKVASDNLIKDGLFNSGVIFKDKLDNLHLGEKSLVRLTSNYTDYEKMDEAWYHLYLLYAREGRMTEADHCLAMLRDGYPQSEWTTLLNDPYFKDNARFGVHIEDSLYAATYDAFKADRLTEVVGNTLVSKNRFPLGENRAKFIFIEGLTKLNAGDPAGCLTDLKEVVEKYPQSEVTELAGMIVKGVQKGRKLYGGKFDLGDVWSRRAMHAATSDSTANDTLSNDRNVNFIFMLAYQPDSVNQNQLLFELARYNFSNFMVRNFDLTVDEDNGLNRMMVSGFQNYDEALQYVRQLYSDKNLARKLVGCHRIIISEDNMKLLGTKYSYAEYEKFFDQKFAPLRVTSEPLLTMPESVTTEKMAEPETESDGNQGENGVDGNFNGGNPKNGQQSGDEPSLFNGAPPVQKGTKQPTGKDQPSLFDGKAPVQQPTKQSATDQPSLFDTKAPIQDTTKKSTEQPSLFDTKTPIQNTRTKQVDEPSLFDKPVPVQQGDAGKSATVPAKPTTMPEKSAMLPTKSTVGSKKNQPVKATLTKQQNQQPTTTKKPVTNTNKNTQKSQQHDVGGFDFDEDFYR